MPPAPRARVAYLQHGRSAGSGVGDVGSIRLDGSGELVLGGGGGARDRFLSFTSDQLLLTGHTGAAPEVRSVALDGSAARVRIGSDGVLAGGAARGDADNRLERLDAALAPTALQLPSTASPLLLLEDGRLVARVAGTGLVGARRTSWNRWARFAP